MADATKVQTKPDPVRRDPVKGARCDGLVSRGRWSGNCSKAATVHVDGRHWCATHDPEAEARRRQASEDRYNIQAAVADGRGAVQDAERRLVHEVEGLDEDVLTTLPAAIVTRVRTLHTARRQLESARARQRELGVKDNWLTRGT